MKLELVVLGPAFETAETDSNTHRRHERVVLLILQRARLAENRGRPSCPI
jgi:hypothetical protein